MRDGYPFARNVLGFSDPSVALVGGRWTMFLGGMARTFRTNIYQFELAEDADITSRGWKPAGSATVSPRRMKPIVRQPPRGAWNRCMHSVCYVRGIADGVEVERIYHAGRDCEWVLNQSKPYRIGFLERRAGQWVSTPEPLALHRADLPSVLEPKVEYHNGRWHMRFLTIPVRLGADDTTQFRIMYTTSANGVDGWTEPVEWFGAPDGFFDSVVVSDESVALMVITRDSNLTGREFDPPQGVWLSQAERASAPRSEWTAPRRLFSAARDGKEWTGNGMCSPSAVWTDESHSRLSVFFAGAPRERTWYRLALRALRSGRRPPVPSPVYFTIGRLDVEISTTDV